MKGQQTSWYRDQKTEDKFKVFLKVTSLLPTNSAVAEAAWEQVRELRFAVPSHVRTRQGQGLALAEVARAVFSWRRWRGQRKPPSAESMHSQPPSAHLWLLLIVSGRRKTEVLFLTVNWNSNYLLSNPSLESVVMESQLPGGEWLRDCFEAQTSGRR